MGNGRCIVLDLDECLIKTMEDGNENLLKEIFNNPKYIQLRGMVFQISIYDLYSPVGTGERLNFWGIRRPHLNTFLTFCFTYFEFVCVWSAGEKSYVEAIVAEIFNGIGDPIIVYSRNELDKKDSDRLYNKPIAKILADPRLGGNAKIEKAVFVDDRQVNFVSSPGNGIVIPGFSPTAYTIQSSLNDVCLLQIRQWLMKPEVEAAPDIRKLNKSSIFTTPVSEITRPMWTDVYNVSPVMFATDNIIGKTYTPIPMDTPIIAYG